MKRGARVESIARRLVRTAREILVDVILTQGGIRYRSGGVVAFTVVEDVGAIEVVEAQVLGEGSEVLVELALQGVGNIIEEGDERIGGGLGCIEERRPELGSIELLFGRTSVLSIVSGGICLTVTRA